MATHSDLIEKLAEYESKYRGAGLARFGISMLYDLYPQEPNQAQGVGHEWARTESWPNSGGAGVYAMFDSDLNVLRVGETGWLGRRLGEYFGYDAADGCRVVHQDWTARPRYIVTVAVDPSADFERLSLEAFLIRELDPPDNVMGKVAKGA